MSATACQEIKTDNTGLLLMLELARSPVNTAGTYNDGSKDSPCYWTGTGKHKLAGAGTHNAAVNSIFVE